MDASSPSRTNRKRSFLIEGAVIAVLFLILNWIVLLYVPLDRQLDANRIYWEKYVQSAVTIRTSPLSFFSFLFNDIRSGQHNALFAIPLLPFYFLFGGERLYFILSIVNTYLLLTFIAFASLLRVMQRKTSLPLSPWHRTCGWATLLLFPHMLRPILGGFPDVAGIAVVFFLLMLYFRKELHQQSWRAVIVMGILMALLILLRRTYSIWTIGFAAMIAVDALLLLFSHRKETANGMRRILRTTAAGIGVLASAAVTLLVLSGPIFIQMLTTNHRTELARWRSASLLLQQTRHVQLIGIITILLVIVAALYLLIRQPSIRKVLLLLFVQSAVTYGVFSYLQNMELHHVYLLLPTALFTVGFAFLTFCSRPHHWLMRTTVGTAFILILSLNILLYIPGASAYISPLSPYLPQWQFAPSTGKTYPEFLRLMDYLLRTTSAKDTIVVADAEFPIRLYQNAYLHLSDRSFEEISSRIIDTNWNRFHISPGKFFSARFVLVRIEKAEKATLPSSLVASSIINGENVGRAYKDTTQRFLLNNRKGKINEYALYERVQPVMQEDIDSLSDLIKRTFPANPESLPVQGQ